MTTVVDPSGTPQPIFNRSGVTIVDVVATSGAPAAPIPHQSGYTIARLTTSGTSPAPEAELPASAEVGDVVEVHYLTNALLLIAPPSAESFASFGGLTEPINGGESATFRKIDPATWSRIR
jgi:hypothetical protein